MKARGREHESKEERERMVGEPFLSSGILRANKGPITEDTCKLTDEPIAS